MASSSNISRAPMIQVVHYQEEIVSSPKVKERISQQGSLYGRNITPPPSSPSSGGCISTIIHLFSKLFMTSSSDNSSIDVPPPSFAVQRAIKSYQNDTVIRRMTGTKYTTHFIDKDVQDLLCNPIARKKYIQRAEALLETFSYYLERMEMDPSKIDVLTGLFRESPLFDELHTAFIDFVIYEKDLEFLPSSGDAVLLGNLVKRVFNHLDKADVTESMAEKIEKSLFLYMNIMQRKEFPENARMTFSSLEKAAPKLFKYLSYEGLGRLQKFGQSVLLEVGEKESDVSIMREEVVATEAHNQQ